MGKPPLTLTVCSTLTCHELAEHSVQTLSFLLRSCSKATPESSCSRSAQPPSGFLPNVFLESLFPVGLCQHCAFSSRPLLPLQCLPCCIYSFLIRLNKLKNSCLLSSRGFGSGGKPLTRCFPQEGAGASLHLCFSLFRKFQHLSRLVSPLLVRAWERAALLLPEM